MFKKFLATCALTTLSIPTGVFAEYNDPGTDYSNAIVNKWTEDQSNEFTKMAASFACILRNTGTGLNANKTWEALMSEKVCGLNDDLQPSELSRAFMKSQRLSNTSDQVGEFYFYGSGDRKFVGNLIGKRGPDQFGPYGEWYVSYYLSQVGSQPPTPMTHATSNMKGLVDISEPTAGSVSIKTVDLYDMRPFQGVNAENWNMISRVEYSDSTLANSRLLGRIFGSENGTSFDTVTAGKTNSNYYYRVKFPYYNNVGGSQNTVVAQCLNRNSLVQSIHEIGIYNKSSGKKVTLKGGFGFKFNSGANRGYFDRWGVWLDTGRLMPFTPETPSLAVVEERNNSNYTLSWSPGRLELLTLQSENLPTNRATVLKFHTPSGEKELHIAKNGANFEATIKNANGTTWTDGSWVIQDGSIVQSDINTHPWLGWGHSEEKRMWVYWDGGTTLKFNVATDKSSDAALLAASYTSFTSKYADPANTNLPVDASTYQAGYGSGSLRNHVRDASARSGNAANTKYYFTGLTPPAGKLARTLYIDKGTIGPVDANGDGIDDDGDAPVMFNFNIDRSSGEYVEFDSSANGYDTANSADWNDDGDDWPYDNVDLLDANGNTFRWKFEANPWGQSVIALDSNGDVYTLDDPLTFQYSHTSANDLNASVTNFSFVAKRDRHNPVRNAKKSSDGSAICSVDGGNNNFENCTLSAADLDGKNFLLEYDGSWLNGLPNVNIFFAANNDSKNYWARLVNPKDGTVLTDVNSGTQYVMKALGVSSAFQAAPSNIYDPTCDPENDVTMTGSVPSNSGIKTCTCDGLTFNSVASFGWDETDLPALSDYPSIAQPFSNVTALEAASECTVTMGDTSGC